MIRLHQHAALVIAADAEALEELLAAQPGRALIGPRLSATVAWADHQRLEALYEALRRAGYRPRLTLDLEAEPPAAPPTRNP